MELGRVIISVFTSPSGKKLDFLRTRFKIVKAYRRRNNSHLLDVLIERHVEYCH